MKRAVLFKNTGLIVRLTQEMDNQYAENVIAVLKIRHRTIQLDTNAAELLVGYFQIMRAYLTNSTGTKQQVVGLFEQVATNLEQRLNVKGKTTANYSDIKELIQQVGCLHDWATKRGLLLHWQENFD